MDSRLKADMQRLQTDHAIDDSLIESLLASPEQARAHLAFWKRMMWGVNGSLICLLTAGAMFPAIRLMSGGSPIWAGAFIFSIGLAGYMTLVLRRQREALGAILQTAHHHNLI